MSIKQNPKFKPGTLIKIRLDRFKRTNVTYYMAATESKRFTFKIEAEDVGLYLEEISYSNNMSVVEMSIAIDEERFPFYSEGTILHKVLFRGNIVYIGQHFLKRLKDDGKETC